MRVLVGGRIGPAILTGVPLVGGLIALTAAVASGSATGTKGAAGIIACAVIGVAVGRRALKWRNLIALLIGVIFFIPVRRYVLPGSAAIQLEPYRVLVAIIAVPVGASETCMRLGGVADGVVCLRTPDPFTAVGLWYEDFGQTTDEEVAHLLSDATLSRPVATKAG
jgi:hypothetical protein